MNKHLSKRETLTIGLMTFALFLGAGNMIFPPALGQAAGTNIWMASAGFLITAVGLPLLGIIAIAKSGGDLQQLAKRVHPIFGIIFTAAVYLALGPFFGIPRTGTVAFEIGVTPFLPEHLNPEGLPLFLYTLLYFGITFLVALNPAKLVDRIGKFLTPLLLLILSVIVIAGIVNPIGTVSKPTEAYKEPFFKGFIEGYLTMDAIAALVFGIVVIHAIQARGVTDRKEITSITTKAGFIAAVGLSFVYFTLSYLGATSRSALGEASNGGEILAGLAHLLFGFSGNILLGLAITFACLTTSVGLVSAAGEYFHQLMPRLSYKLLIFIFTFFSMIIANIGLTQLISMTVPVLIAIYPIAISLISLSFFDPLFKGYTEVYRGGIIGAAFISIVDGLTAGGFQLELINNILLSFPFSEQGIGWIMPSVLGAVIGYIIAITRSSAKHAPANT
ncbi:branched-chain amino acid transport system II carrier protein [Bacillus taeanensis]|uniref:Branched-chain amino acid transport system carrier protein n=1 Tax=Bacillus taeanensis TaxID=273032 RepID=A0A366Y0T1_9BACI|nr:branched-chain amino acid transport system II carrier protein [Bacillus taeanensis]RBW71456.1 branched-chain amino acid transport system II carrier protein [Bacillus taeanensis]